MGFFDLFRKKKEPQHGIIYKMKGKVIAKSLSSVDICDFMYYDKNSRPDCCPICHNKLHFIPNQDISVKLKRSDIGCTYDGYDIVSEKFYNFCMEGKYPGLIFTPLEKSKGLFFFEATEIFGLDYAYNEHIKTKFLNKRDCCGTYDEVISPPMVRAKTYKMASNDFIMTADYFWGSHERKGKLKIVGTETAQKMKEYGLKGIYFENIYDPIGLQITEEEVNHKVWE